MDNNAEATISEDESELSTDSEDDTAAESTGLRSIAQDALVCAADCVHRQDYGKAFACYLLAAQVIPSCKSNIKRDFSRTLLQWTEALNSLGREDDALSCCIQACEVFPENEHSWLAYGSVLSSRELYLEALEPLETAVRLAPVSPRARECLHGVLNYLLERWHFRMLNDCERNSQYELALRRAIASGHTSVLDIGSGSGILSLMAARAGASVVHGCDMSKLLIDISKEVVAANGYSDHITLHHRKSTDLRIPDDLFHRVSLVVTETVDSGLLGEFTIPTLRHAWKHLLLPPAPCQLDSNSTLASGKEKMVVEGSDEPNSVQYGRVIPSSASVFAFVIDCPAVRYHSRLSNTNVAGFDMSDFLFVGSSHLENIELATNVSSTNLPKQHRSCKAVSQSMTVKRSAEPYTTEELTRLRGGFQSLTQPRAMLKFDFNDPEVPLPPPAVVEVAVEFCGWCDAIAMYFELNLDEFAMLSTAPAARPAAWEQAIFPVTRDLLAADLSSGCSATGASSGLWLCCGDLVSLAAEPCTESCLSLRVVEVKRSTQSLSRCKNCTLAHSQDSSLKNPGKGNVALSKQLSGKRLLQPGKDILSGASKEDFVVYIDRPDLARLNDTSYWTAWQAAISPCYQNKEQSVCAASNHKSKDKPLSNSASLSWGELPRPTSSQSSLPYQQGSAGVTQMKKVLDLTHGLPLTGLLALKEGAHVTVCCAAYELIPTIEQLAKGLHAEHRLLLSTPTKELSTAAPQWDIVMADVISPCGLLYSNSLEQLSVASCCLRSGGYLLPRRLRVFGVCVDCPALRAHGTVLGTMPTLGFDVARFINRYQVNTHIDLDLLSLPHTPLSAKVKLLDLDLKHLPLADQVIGGKMQAEVTVGIANSGSLTGVVFWFELELTDSLVITNQPSTDVMNHWHQAAIVLDEDCSVTVGDQLLLETVCEDSCFSIAVSNTDQPTN